MYLFIGTTEHNKVKLKLWQGSGVNSLEKGLDRNLSERLLFIIQDFLKINKIKLTDISGIAVLVGKGSFTGIRTGVSTANALGFALNLPVISVKTFKNYKKLKGKDKQENKTQAFPVYGKAPNITVSKK